MQRFNMYTGDVKDEAIEKIVSSDLPDGWKEIGCKMLSEIDEIAGEIFTIMQLKEKYGMLRLYYHLDTSDELIFKKVREIVDKYELASKVTCAFCGKHGKMRYNNWIIPLCDECSRKENT